MLPTVTLLAMQLWPALSCVCTINMYIYIYLPRLLTCTYMYLHVHVQLHNWLLHILSLSFPECCSYLHVRRFYLCLVPRILYIILSGLWRVASVHVHVHVQQSIRYMVSNRRLGLLVGVATCTSTCRFDVLVVPGIIHVHTLSGLRRVVSGHVQQFIQYIPGFE
jgi:hypothetical protein